MAADLSLNGFPMKPFPRAEAAAAIGALFISLQLISPARAGADLPTNEMVSFVSRVTQGTAGAFDIAMPLTGPAGIESRIASSYLGVATYAEDIDPECECYYLLNGERTDVDLIAGAQAFFTFSTLTAFQVNLVTVTCGGSETTVPFALAYADVNATGVVNHEDKLQVRLHIGMPLTSDDFRDDVNANGKIDQQDGVLVRAYKGQSLPP